jgi:hypothetical protein
MKFEMMGIGDSNSCDTTTTTRSPVAHCSSRRRRHAPLAACKRNLIRSIVVFDHDVRIAQTHHVRSRTRGVSDPGAVDETGSPATTSLSPTAVPYRVPSRAAVFTALNVANARPSSMMPNNNRKSRGAIIANSTRLAPRSSRFPADTRHYSGRQEVIEA